MKLRGAPRHPSTLSKCLMATTIIFSTPGCPTTAMRKLPCTATPSLSPSCAGNVFC